MTTLSRLTSLVTATRADLPACSTTLYPVEITFVFSALFRSLVVRSFAIPSLHKYLAWFAYQKLAAYALDILAFRTSAGAASLPAYFPKFSCRVAVGLPGAKPVSFAL